MGQQHPVDLAGSFASMARDLFTRTSIDETLEHMSKLAVAAIAGCDHAGVWVLDGAGAIATQIESDPLVGRVDALQREEDQGPCLDALRGELVVLAEDLASDQRYPRFAPRAIEAGVSGVLSQRLAVGDAGFGSLNLYADRRHAFSEQSVEAATLFAAHAGIVLSAAHARADMAKEEEGLRTALTSRDVIGQAKGILMERQKITADQAFDILRRTSQQLNIKLRDVAERLADTGELPDGG